MPVTPPFADPIDVAGIWRPLTDAEVPVAINLIADASQMLLEYPGVAVRNTAGLIAPATLRDVCKRMVRRAMQNPEGLRQYSLTVDDATKSGTFENPGGGFLFVEPDELARLLGQMGSDSTGAFSISTLPPSTPEPDGIYLTWPT